MTAITKSWTTIADAAVDPDSPLTTSLMTALRDNDIYLREWLGASYTAGAVQDHSHDGVDSALIEIGPNFARNGSFESGESAWTFTDYAGGSHAVSTSVHRHGAKSITFTSTSTANGGGEAITTAYTPVAEGEDYPWKFWVWASVANVSSKVQLVWYDNAKGSLSTTDVYTSTNTSTSASLQRGATTAPASARWVRLRLIGGVPASGSSTGTIRFDGVVLSDVAAVNGTHILAASIAQGHLKSTFGDVGTTSTSPVQITPAGGSYGFWPQIYTTNASFAVTWTATGSTTATSPTSVSALSSGAGAVTVYLRQYYVQASPPYDLGDGEIPLFAYLALDANGAPLHSYVAEDPPWANNGPTDIRATRYADGRAFKRVRDIALPRAALRGTPAERAAYLAALSDAPWTEIEITQAMKQADMPLIPHPFADAMAGVAQVVLLQPVGLAAERLHRLHLEGESLASLLTEGWMEFDNTPLPLAAPPGVQPVRYRWKNT